MELSLQSRTSRTRSSQEAAHQLFKENSSYLSAQFYPFLGRRQEVKEVCAWLCSAETRLLTLTGMGGVGKTRLALQVARELVAEFVNGVYFVSLASVNDPALVIPTIAQA